MQDATLRFLLFFAIRGLRVSPYTEICGRTNADGLRISKSVTSDGVTTSTRFLYEGGYITLEMDGSGTQTAYNVFGGSSIISRTTAQGTGYYLYNGRGDVVQLTNAWGVVTVSYDYDAFGNLMESYNNDFNPFRYSGEYFDLCSKRYYLRSRYYDPSTGRFTQRDAFLGFYTDPLSLNRYTYGHNNPIRYCDPTGYVVTEWDLKNCTPEQIKQIKDATDAWNNATTQAEKDAAHASANAARSGNLSTGQYVSSEGYVRESNGTAASGGSTNVYLGTTSSSTTTKKSVSGNSSNSKDTVAVEAQVENNINSAYNAWQGGYITFAQYVDNVSINLGNSLKSTSQVNSSGGSSTKTASAETDFEVLLRYIIEKNGGTVTANQRSIFGASITFSK